jgi:hypothetical protein
VLTASIIRTITLTIALMMETVSTSETQINIYQTTRHNIPEDIILAAVRTSNVN